MIFLRPPIGDPSDPFSDEEWEDHVTGWMSRCEPAGVINEIQGFAVRVDEWSAADYLASDPLDLDYLSPA